MDELIRHITEEVPWCMLFANNIILVYDIREWIASKVKMWREVSYLWDLELVKQRQNICGIILVVL